MERRRGGRFPIDDPLPASLWLGPVREHVALCDVSAGGARLRIVNGVSSGLRAAVGELRPCRLEVGDLGTLTAVPRWLGPSPGGERFLGMTLQGPESVAPLSAIAPSPAGEAATISWVRFFARRALLLQIAGQPEEALRSRRRALRQTTAFVERTLQRVSMFGDTLAFLDETAPDALERGLAAAADLARLAAWTGASDAALAAATLRVVVHLAEGAPALAEALETHAMLAESAELPLARWTAEALRALSEERPARRAKAAAAALAHRDLPGIVDTPDGFPAASLVGVLSAALAVVPFTGRSSPEARRRRSVRGRRGRRASVQATGG